MYPQKCTHATNVYKRTLYVPIKKLSEKSSRKSVHQEQICEYFILPLTPNYQFCIIFDNSVNLYERHKILTNQ